VLAVLSSVLSERRSIVFPADNPDVLGEGGRCVAVAAAEQAHQGARPFTHVVYVISLICACVTSGERTLLANTIPAGSACQLNGTVSSELRRSQSVLHLPL